MEQKQSVPQAREVTDSKQRPERERFKAKLSRQMPIQ